MIRTQKYETLQYLTADGITVPYGFTTRLGGVSTGTQGSLNLAVGRGTLWKTWRKTSAASAAPWASTRKNW